MRDQPKGAEGEMRVLRAGSWSGRAGGDRRHRRAYEPGVGAADHWHAGIAERQHDDHGHAAAAARTPSSVASSRTTAFQSKPWWAPRVVPPKSETRGEIIRLRSGASMTWRARCRRGHHLPAATAQVVA